MVDDDDYAIDQVSCVRNDDDDYGDDTGYGHGYDDAVFKSI